MAIIYSHILLVGVIFLFSFSIIINSQEIYGSGDEKKIDVVTSNGNHESWSLFFGDGNGNFPVRTDTSVSSSGTLISIAVGDLNGDGKDDLILGDEVGKLWIYLGKGMGFFEDPQIFFTDSANEDMVVSDFNKDGYQDVAIADSNKEVEADVEIEDSQFDLTFFETNHSHVSILFGDPAGNFVFSPEFPVDIQPETIRVGDFNEDGYFDLVTANGGQISGPPDVYADTVSVLLNDGNGDFSSRTDLAVGERPHGVAVGDFNNDFHQDIVSANVFDPTITLWFGNGDGTFDSRSDIVVSDVEDQLSVTAAFLNQDFNEDLIITYELGDKIAILLGKGDGAFEDPITYPADIPQKAIAVDLNHDDILDILVSNPGVPAISSYLGNGDGTFNPKMDFATVTGSNEFFDMALGSFNNFDDAVAGELLSVNSLALVVAGITSSGVWIIPIILSVVGIGYIFARRKF